MKKLLGIGAALLLVLLLLMWRSTQGDAPQAEPKAPTPEPEQVAVAPVKRTKPIVEAPYDPKMAGNTEKPADGKVEKLDHMSDEFFYKFTEKVPKVLTSQAAVCYETLQGSLHRNAKLVLKFKVVVKNGVVSVQDVKVKDPDDPKQKTNSLNNASLETCFIQKVARAGWKDEALPDYEWPDELVLRPERGMKGYWKSNREYVGAEAPKRDPKAHLAIKPPPDPDEPKPEPKKD